MSARERAELLHELARFGRRMESSFTDVLDVVDRKAEFRADGHASVKGWYLAHTNDAPVEAFRKVRTMRALRTLPAVRDGLRSGEIGVAQVRVIAKMHANPRVREDLPAAESQIVDNAHSMPFVEFEATAQQLADLIDVDGAEQRAEAVHADRRAHHSKLGDGWRGDYTCGAAQGAAMQRILQDFCEREFQADWAEAKARLGDRVTVADLARTASQRRMDALYNIFLSAAAAVPGAQRPEPLVNLVMDDRTYNETAQWVATGVRPPLDLCDYASRRCHTTDGDPIPRSDALAAALIGQMRRVVVNSAGVVINMGRKARLFTGNARDAVMLRSTHCVWTGCTMPGSTSQADHLDAWGHGGETNSDIGCPCCGRHNRWKTKGFTIQPEPNGRWRTLRPDGTAINDPPAA